MNQFRKARAAHLRLGAAGESAAARMLENAGCEILMRDCRMRSGEIDLIARDGLQLIFVEVKTRRQKQEKECRPAANLRPRQKRRIYRAALAYLKKIGNPSVPFRFDLVEVLYSRFGLSRMYHWKSHFGGRSSDYRSGSPSQPVNYFN